MQTLLKRIGITLAFGLIAGFSFGTVTVQVKGKLVDISEAKEGNFLYLLAKTLKFERNMPALIRGMEFARRTAEAQDTLYIRCTGKCPVYIAVTDRLTAPGQWTEEPVEWRSGEVNFFIYSTLTEPDRWLEIPRSGTYSTLVFARDMQLTGYAPVPGKIIYHSPVAKKYFVTDPALVILPDGSYIAGCKSRFDGKESRVRLFGSTDKGENWSVITDIPDAGFYNLFVHRGALYLMGTQGGFNRMIILRSDDKGKTWSVPVDSKHGMLSGESKSYHSASVPVVVANGRIWRAMEDNIPLGGRHFRAFVMSAPVDADLLDSSVWTRSEPLPYNPSWLGPDKTFNGWLEGNAVVTREGDVVDILRIEERNFDGKAARITIGSDGTKAIFDPATDLIDLPGASKKFVIRFDSVSDKYWTLTNHVFDRDRGKEHCGLLRNRLVLLCSSDLQSWEIQDTLFSHEDPHFHALQYIDWLIDGKDIIAVSRTAWEDENGLPRRQHDANYLTFHRFESFRNRNYIKNGDIRRQ